jgi:glycosyltransferase involved in cell wall biosynthesis
MLGSVVPRKGQLAFLDALAQKPIGGAYQITIAGSLTVDKDYAKKCTDAILADATLRQHVKITGEQSATSIQTLYVKSNLFISTSEMETFGMAIQDAVAFGIPVFALKGGYAAEQVVEGVNGHQCTTHAEMVEKLAHYVQYPDSFVDLQRSAFSYTPSYHTWDKAAERLIGFAGEVVKFS